ncbi:DUF4352 domain-containing protein [Streptosporangium sp. NPDC023825]|uniref:DUF4352 domain-containing protein n=1 Tax=Streptosporangium sp. NPDC023825 TaxID=3154909 RepID=UPI00344410F9
MHPNQPYGHYPQQPPKKKRTGLKILAALIISVIALGSCVALVSGGTDTTTVDEPSAGKSSGGKSTKPKPAKASEPGMGDVVKDGKFAFKVTKTEKKTEVGSEFLNKKAQGEFLLVRVTVKNIADEAQTFFGEAQKVYDAKGREYKADSEAALYLESSKSLYEQINPGNSVNGVILFDLPRGVTAVKIKLHDSLFSSGVEVELS